MQYLSPAPLMAPAVDVTDMRFIGERAGAAAYAAKAGNFWLPCPLCGISFGGHETALGPPANDAYPAHIPDENNPPAKLDGPDGFGWSMGYLTICPYCVRANRSWDWPLPDAGASSPTETQE